MKTTLLAFCGAVCVSTVSLQGANIVWVSFHPGDNQPSAAAAAAGFTQAPDALYTQLLAANGHNVTRMVTLDNAGMNAGALNAADLVIISRSVPSGHYQTDAETAFWNSTITAPVMLLGGYIIRGGTGGGSRLGYTTGETIPDVAAPEVRLTAVNPSHPIFAGVSLDLANTMVDPYARMVSYTNTPQRGISVNNNTLAGGGTLLATVGNVGDPAFGGMVIGEWQAGSVMGTTPADTLGGHRLVFLTGSRENAAIAGGAPALTSEASGIYDLDPAGAQMFLNAVGYMVTPVPEPSTWALIGLGLGAFGLLRFRKK